MPPPQELRAVIPPDAGNSGDNFESTADSVLVTLSMEETQQLLREVHVAYHTQINDILVSAYATFARRRERTGKICLWMEGHGRQGWEDLDISRTVGWFTALFPLALDPVRDANAPQIIKQVKEELRLAAVKGACFGIVRHLAPLSAAGRRLREWPQPELIFNYLGQLEQSLPTSNPVHFMADAGGATRSPRARRPAALELTAAVVAGCAMRLPRPP